MTQRPIDPTTGLQLSSLVSELATGSLEGWRVHTQAQQDRAAGRDVIVLSVGDPDFDTPGPITERAIAALVEGRTHYTPAAGIAPMIDAVALFESKRLDRQVAREEVVVCSGAQNALYAAMRCIIDQGDEVILLSPPYTMFEGVVRCAGGTPVTVPLDRVNGFRIDTDAMAQVLSERTKAVLVNSPHNPSGAVASTEETEALSRFCIDNGLWLVSDEVYADLCYEEPFVSPSSRADMLERTIVIRSMSKSHAMSGWRVGWALAPLAVRNGMDDVLNHVLYGSPAFVQLAAVTALTHDINEVEDMKQAYRSRRDVACAAFGTIPGVEVMKPASGLFCIMDISRLGVTSLSFAEQLYDAEGVSILPGEAFGDEHDDWMRLALCQPATVIREAAERMARFVASGKLARASAAQ
jgi:arginine:pyruvate transaminase